MLIFSGLLFFLLSCNNQAVKSAEVEQVDTLFRNWLNKHHLNAASFQDSIVDLADSIWDYATPLVRTDSLYKWYPSADSSYVLLTNIDHTDRRSIFRENDDIEYRFLDLKTRKIYIGITLLYEGPMTPVDLFWQGPHTIYLLEQVKATKKLQLIKLDMLKDSIWSYPSNVQKEL